MARSTIEHEDNPMQVVDFCRKSDRRLLAQRYTKKAAYGARKFASFYDWIQ